MKSTTMKHLCSKNITEANVWSAVNSTSSKNIFGLVAKLSSCTNMESSCEGCSFCGQTQLACWSAGTRIALACNARGWSPFSRNKSCEPKQNQTQEHTNWRTTTPPHVDILKLQKWSHKDRIWEKPRSLIIEADLCMWQSGTDEWFIGTLLVSAREQ